MKSTKLASWVTDLEALLTLKLQEKPHGDLHRWLAAFDSLPDLEPEQS